MHFTPIHFAEIQSNAELFEIYNATGEFLLYTSFFDEQEGKGIKTKDSTKAVFSQVMFKEEYTQNNNLNGGF